MKSAPIPNNEKLRLMTLDRYQVLDTEAEQCFDDITKLASVICNTPISLVSLIDSNRQWFKSKVGLEANETSRDISFCGHAILKDDVFIVENALLDDRFSDNPLVVGEPSIRFYAGAPLKTSKGYKIGTLCIIDSQPREFRQQDIEILEKVASDIVFLIDYPQLKYHGKSYFQTLSNHFH